MLGDGKGCTLPSSLIECEWSRSAASSSSVFFSLRTSHGPLTRRQQLFFLRQLWKFGMSPNILKTFYICTVERILTSHLTAWYEKRYKALQRVVWMAQHSMTSTPGCVRKAQRIIRVSSHLNHWGALATTIRQTISQQYLLAGHQSVELITLRQTEPTLPSLHCTLSFRFTLNSD